MSYLVPTELPKSCVKCPFGACKFSHPWGTSNYDRKPIKGYYCQLDTNKPKRVLTMDYDDETTKMEWCPLKEFQG